MVATPPQWQCDMGVVTISHFVIFSVQQNFFMLFEFEQVYLEEMGGGVVDWDH